MDERITAARLKLDGQTVEMGEVNGVWTASQVVPMFRGDYPVMIELDTIEGKTYTYDGTAAAWDDRLTVQVQRDGQPVDLLSYLPVILQSVDDLQVICGTEGLELERLYDLTQDIFTESCITTMSERRLQEWERALQLVAKGTLAQRKTYLEAVLLGQGKLTGDMIRQIAQVFTGRDTVVDFYDATVCIRIIYPVTWQDIADQCPIWQDVAEQCPTWKEVLDYTPAWIIASLKQIIVPRLPAHLNLTVSRYRACWVDMQKDFLTWKDVADHFATWQGVFDYVARSDQPWV